MSLTPREKAVKKIADSYHAMNSFQQAKAVEKVKRIVKGDQG